VTALSAAFSAVKKMVSAEVAASGFKFKFDRSKLGESGGATLIPPPPSEVEP
jgi:hypothetical protein